MFSATSSLLASALFLKTAAPVLTGVPVIDPHHPQQKMTVNWDLRNPDQAPTTFSYLKVGDGLASQQDSQQESQQESQTDTAKASKKTPKSTKSTKPAKPISVVVSLPIIGHQKVDLTENIEGSEEILTVQNTDGSVFHILVGTYKNKKYILEHIYSDTDQYIFKPDSSGFAISSSVQDAKTRWQFSDFKIEATTSQESTDESGAVAQINEVVIYMLTPLTTKASSTGLDGKFILQEMRRKKIMSNTPTATIQETALPAADSMIAQ